jgi:hypothetical protein
MSASLSLDAIAYGGFTRGGADEAYVTYSSDAEPHANNFGGGILFRRARGAWHVVRWHPGQKMDDCVALPGVGPQRMLCLVGYAGMGEADSMVEIQHVDRSVHKVPSRDDSILKAQDGSGTDNRAYYYEPAWHAHKALLLSIDDLKRSNEPGILAVSKAIWLTPREVARICRTKKFDVAHETSGTIRYVMRNGRVTAIAPENFAPPDY